VSVRLLSRLQWTGLFAGALAFAFEQVAGYGLTNDECGPDGMLLGLGNDAWQGIFLASGVAVLAAAEACAVTVLLRTRGVPAEDVAGSRMRFFAIGAVVANALFFAVMLLSGIASIADPLCRQA
jgi:hypothetical protein